MNLQYRHVLFGRESFKISSRVLSGQLFPIDKHRREYRIIERASVYNKSFFYFYFLLLKIYCSRSKVIHGNNSGYR